MSRREPLIPHTDQEDTTLEKVSRRILILANPTAGGYRVATLDAIVAGLAERGAAVSVHLTTHAGEIAEICAGQIDCADTLVVAGGDGSVNEALTGLDDAPCRPVLGIIPFGTANVLAHELGLPRKPDQLAAVLAAGKTAPLHYGLANGHPFVMMVSAGFDAEIVHRVPLKLKRRLGKLAYAITALRYGLANKGRDLRVTVDGDELTCRLAVVTNMRHYGGPFAICPDAHATKPGLHLVALESDSPLALARFSFGLVTQRLAHQHGVTLRPVERVTIAAENPVPGQIDGDPFGTTPFDVTAAQATVPIIIP
ncbi:MAG: sphingosine kinase [Hyphomicrobiales bacterium]|nr:MAG: sphingosine kinase [Hyphomicrobiales bacterium]